MNICTFEEITVTDERQAKRYQKMPVVKPSGGEKRTYYIMNKKWSWSCSPVCTVRVFVRCYDNWYHIDFVLSSFHSRSFKRIFSLLTSKNIPTEWEYDKEERLSTTQVLTFQWITRFVHCQDTNLSFVCCWQVFSLIFCEEKQNKYKIIQFLCLFVRCSY